MRRREVPRFLGELARIRKIVATIEQHLSTANAKKESGILKVVVPTSETPTGYVGQAVLEKGVQSGVIIRMGLIGPMGLMGRFH